jgi:thiamine-monophosphate kinase
MRIEEIGEFGLIRRIRKKTPLKVPGIVMGIGDDSAVFKTNPGKLVLATCDMLVERVHFDLNFFTFFQVGKRAMALNLSDIAAMGGVPRYALVSLGLPKKTKVEFIDDLYRGMKNLGSKFAVEIIGGDTVESPEGIVLNLTLWGEVERNFLVLRSGAKVGDSILVTGTLGDSRAALALLKSGLRIKGSGFRRIVKKYLTPAPRVKEARSIVRHRGATSMTDSSDGLSQEISHLTSASKVGAEIWMDKIPLSLSAIKAARVLRKDPLDFAFYGGEDLELIFTAPPKKVNILLKKVPQLTKTPLTVIGRITKREEGLKVIYEQGKVKRFENKGYEHFKM